MSGKSSNTDWVPPWGHQGGGGQILSCTLYGYPGYPAKTSSLFEHLTFGVLALRLRSLFDKKKKIHATIKLCSSRPLSKLHTTPP